MKNPLTCKLRYSRPWKHPVQIRYIQRWRGGINREHYEIKFRINMPFGGVDRGDGISETLAPEHWEMGMRNPSTCTYHNTSYFEHPWRTRYIAGYWYGRRGNDWSRFGYVDDKLRSGMIFGNVRRGNSLIERIPIFERSEKK